MKYEFGDCVLDSATQELWRAGELVGVEPQVLAVLEYLVSHNDRVVTKIELLDEVWGDRFVSESALTSRIKLARRACGDSGREQRIVRTVHGRGYRVVAEVVEHRHGQARSRDMSFPADALAEELAVGVVGRHDELELMDAAIGVVEGGERRSIFITGEAGSGKSTLVAELIERNDHLESWFVLRGQCLQTRSGVEPYFALLDALTNLSHAQPEAVTSSLERVAPSWLAQLPGLVDDETAERLERRLLGSTPQRMLREGAEAFQELARYRPVMLVLEDLHWADDCTLDVLDLLVQRRDPLPLLIVGTSRDEPAPIDAVIASGSATGRATAVRLDGLDPVAIGALVQDRFAGATIPDELIDIVADRCDGVPLFAHEILNTWLYQGQIEVGAGELRTAMPLSEMEAVVPHTLLALIERKLSDLEPAEIGALEAAAVAGLSFDGASVAAGLEQSVADAEVTLASLARRSNYIGAEGDTSWTDGTISTAFSFSHQLYRDVVYGRTTAGRRAELHGLIGLALERHDQERSGEMVVRLAEHFVEAGDSPRAIEYLKLAGEQASARSAHDHAVEFLTAALERTAALAPGIDRDRTELRVRVALGPALVATRGWIDDAVPDNYERAVALSGEVGPCPEAASARYGLATVTELRGEFARTEELLSPLLASETPGDLAMEAHELVACSTFHQGAFRRSERNSGMVLDYWDDDTYSVLMARIAEHPASSCNSWLSLSSWFLGRSDESMERADRAIALGEENLYALATAAQQRAMLHQLRNEPARCLEWAARTREVGREQGFPMRVIQADIFKGWALGVSGSAEEGSSLIADGLARFRLADAKLNEAYYMAMQADTQLHDRHPADALDVLGRALDVMRQTTRSYFHESEIHRLRARALIQLHRDNGVDAARAALDESRSVAEALGAPALLLRTATDRLSLEVEHGDPATWRADLARLVAVYEGQGTTPDVARACEMLTL